MSETEKWTEEDQAVLEQIAETDHSRRGDSVERAARILAHMIGAEVPPGEGDAD